MIVIYNHSLIVLANGITIVNYNRKEFKVQATEAVVFLVVFDPSMNEL